jgi:hypothetical protein
MACAACLESQCQGAYRGSRIVWSSHAQPIASYPVIYHILIKVNKYTNQDINSNFSEPVITNFTKQVVDILDELRSHGATEFEKYFLGYLKPGRVELWRASDRRLAVANVNMALERFHLTMKETFFKRSQNKRLDECIDLLLKIADYSCDQHDITASLDHETLT